MRRGMLILIAVLALGGCSTLGKEKAPTCDGKHRRPANLYGSVLDPTAPPASAPAKPDKLSAIAPSSYGSCGA